MAKVSILKATYSEVAIEPLLEPLGGMKRFIEEGDRVLLKVNLLSAREPEKAVTTHPEIVRAAAKAVRKAGGHPYIGDSPSGLFSKRTLAKAYDRSGLKRMADMENIPLNYDTGTRKLDLPGAVKLKKSLVCNYILKADKVIALPKLKTHSFQYMTLACKNMYGAIPGLLKARYHARFPRRTSFADMLLDVLTAVKPDLVIMDGILGMQGQGPGSGEPIELGCVLASRDPVAADISACEIIGIEPVDIPILKRAKIRRLWPEKIEYPLLKPEDVGIKDFRLPTTAEHLLTGAKAPGKSPIVTDKCIGCGECEAICPKSAIAVEDETAVVNYSKCIRCFCCHEVCPENAIKLGPARLMN